VEFVRIVPEFVSRGVLSPWCPSDVFGYKTSMRKIRKEKPMQATQANRPMFSQPRFPKEVYEEIRTAAKSEGLAISTWIRRVCVLALEARRQKSDLRD
jgi:hypothetical protein